MDFPVVGYGPAWQPAWQPSAAPGVMSSAAITPLNVNASATSPINNAYCGAPDRSSMSMALLSMMNTLLLMMTQLFAGQSAFKASSNLGSGLDFAKYTPQT